MEDDVREHPADLVNQLVGTVLILEIKGRGPIDRLILRDSARCAVRIDQIVVSGFLGKARRPVDVVDVLGNFAGINQGVDPTKTNTSMAFHTPKSLGSAKGGRYGQQTVTLHLEANVEGAT